MKNKKKILVTTSTFPRSEDDTEPRFILDLSQSLSEYYDVTVLAPADPTSKLEEKFGDVKVIRYRYAPLRSWEKLAYPGAIVPKLKANPIYWLLVPLLFTGLLLAAFRELKKKHYDAVHVHWLLPQGIIQALLSYFDNTPFIVTSHGGDIHTFNKGVFPGIFRWVVKRSAAVTVVSHQIKKNMTHMLGVNPDAIEVIPMGADFGSFSPKFKNNDWPGRHDLSGIVFLFVGRIAEKKGLKYLLEAFSLEPLRSQDATLAIVGDGPLKQEMVALSEKLQITDKVKFLGPATHSELQTIYASSNIFCIPSIIASNGDAEGLPTVLSEAAASGLPSIGTNTGGIPEIVKDNETGLLVKQKTPKALVDACMSYIQNPEKLKEHSNLARVKTADYSWDKIGKRYYKLIRRVLVKEN